MRGLLDRIFGKKPTLAEQAKEAIASVYDPTNEHDRVGVACLAILQKQLDLLGFEIRQVPAEGRFMSEKCRGCLYGTALGILVSEGVELTKDRLIDTLIAVFVLTYGEPVGREIAQQTMQDVMSDNRDVVWASDWAVQDTKGVYASGGTTSAVGFYLAATATL